ncbi:hypothetical protein MJA45_17285 [Paenibacillus aurantius]|uniref:Uncharacterized protein n=1 Tax=Paenibacillus aurantius TaxID=2918900 RepID=A0AA96LA68_9BACL|nr:hypothetical protein [Paenibacillus aurantius]WNQ09379.1 hypothetical protein MJA45_17285 [Paenibacillus aurantius]
MSFELYDGMPTYSILHHIGLSFHDFNGEEKDYMWEKYLSYLSSEDNSLSKPVEYSLWCHFFEDQELVEDSWERIFNQPRKDRLIQRILIASGPVPYTLKNPLYSRLIKDLKWHYYIYRSLLHSAFDYFGNIEKEKALELLEQLKLSEDVKNLELLKEKLKQ